MHSTQSEVLMYSRVTMLGLLMKCPFKSALPECPLNGLRSDLPLIEKFRLIECLNPITQEQILAQHHTCYNKRMKNIITPCPDNSQTSDDGISHAHSSR
ncbi:MAG: hypothetical protein KKB30_12260 [Proteobacteria bacterium]|nr:hypothetical protein [Pseudomonadota bacterium]MBU1715246.1 hypothetical protein [Pseudomonadota bacterium]